MVMSVEVPEKLWGTGGICGGWNPWDNGVGQRDQSLPTHPMKPRTSVLTDGGSLRIWHYLIVGITELYLWTLKE